MKKSPQIWKKARKYVGEFGGRKNDAFILQSQEIEEIINKESALSYVYYSHTRLRFVGVKKN